MDVLVTLWSASVLAAISFFVAGLATHAAVLRRREAPMQGANAALDEARAREQQARAHAAELESAMMRAQEQLRAESARAQLASEDVRTLRASAATLVGLDQELETARVSARRAETELAKIRASATTAENRATAAENRATALEKKAAATELELESMKERVAALGTELANARPKRPQRPRPPIVTRRSVVTDLHGDTVESSLAARLGTFADECGYEVVVLSDAQGLLLAGVGDEQVQGTIAALSSVARELTTRAAEFVELRPKLIEVTDDAGRTLRIRLFQWEQEPIALASFGMGHTEPTEEEETVITVFPSLMEAS